MSEKPKRIQRKRTKGWRMPVAPFTLYTMGQVQGDPAPAPPAQEQY